MLQVTIRPCQVTLDGKKHTVGAGFVFDAKKLHTHARRLDDPDTGVDFHTAGEEELMASKWLMKDARKYLKDAFDIKMKPGSKKEVIEQILDARYRAVDLPKG